MALNSQKGNMYGFVTHTWNTIKGLCEHNCSYCYMKRWEKLRVQRFDSKELRTDLGSNNFIFVGSSCDLFAESINPEWVMLTLEHCSRFENKYLFQTKNPENFNRYKELLPVNSVSCTTIESNRFYAEFMGNTIEPEKRALAMSRLDMFDKHITIEPIMDFDLPQVIDLVKLCSPSQVNIGADSGGHHLPEPSKDKILSLIEELNKFTTVFQKKNLKRLVK